MNFVNEAALFDVVGKCLWGKIKSIESFDGTWYMRVRRVRIKVFKKQLFDDVST
jgi:hypothetical protein